ncbi:MAG TPA: M48 family metallopeptidase [Kiritimatiellia bacterium]|nr:M48 family metallopeptidase [Kiritimatiellia bacterium]HMO99824.1 M48 family metallopeptidase [Kiritimatiellia bacterium]HMP97304.1 M48 family metallopeptidase [Kiritimatiellia bacterium]
MNGFLILILIILIADALLQFVVNALNVRRLQTDLPEEFKGWYDADRYQQSQIYLRTTTRFEQAQLLVTTGVLAAFLIAGGFGWLDQVARSAGGGLILTGLLFTGMLILAATLLGLPFRLYDTFVIEARHGFNRTTPGTFIADQLKSLALTALLGGPLLAGILWFFAEAGSWGWLIAWGVVIAFQFVMILLGPSLILPLFNTFTPLPEGELRTSIEAYARGQSVPLSGIYAIDGSRRSSKANAYVTGLGRLKRIALFDTLVAKHTVSELVAVLAHEVGHAKLGHIRTMLLISSLTTGFMFFLLSLFLREPGLYKAMQVPWPSGEPAPLYAGMIAFGLLMAPLNRLLAVWGNHRSRRHEYEADAFAVRTTGDAEAMITALKKLSVENLSNLSPHPLMVWLEYSHPPILERIRALRAPGRTA